MLLLLLLAWHYPSNRNSEISHLVVDTNSNQGASFVVVFVTICCVLDSTLHFFLQSFISIVKFLDSKRLDGHLAKCISLQLGLVVVCSQCALSLGWLFSGTVGRLVWSLPQTAFLTA